MQGKILMKLITAEESKKTPTFTKKDIIKLIEDFEGEKLVIFYNPQDISEEDMEKIKEDYKSLIKETCPILQEKNLVVMRYKDLKLSNLIVKEEFEYSYPLENSIKYTALDLAKNQVLEEIKW